MLNSLTWFSFSYFFKSMGVLFPLCSWVAQGLFLKLKKLLRLNYSGHLPPMLPFCCWLNAMFVSSRPSSTRVLLLHWRNLSSFPCVKSVSTADAALQFKEPRSAVKVPRSLGALRSWCLSAESSLKVFGARTSNPSKQSGSLGNDLVKLGHGILWNYQGKALW